MRTLIEDVRNIPTPLALVSRVGLIGDIKSAYLKLLRAAISTDTDVDLGYQDVADLRRIALWLEDATEERVLPPNEHISAANVASTLLEFVARANTVSDSGTIFEPPLVDYLRSAILGSFVPFQAQTSFNAERMAIALRDASGLTKVQECHRMAALNVVSFLGRRFTEPISQSFRFRLLAREAGIELVQRDADNSEKSELDLAITIGRACTNASAGMLTGASDLITHAERQFRGVAENARDYGDADRYWLASKLIDVTGQMSRASTHRVLQEKGIPHSFISALARDNVLELWEPQLEAIRKGLLDGQPSNFVVTIPTGAGKTLIAELAIIAALRSESPSWAIYVTPSRALAGQVSSDLKRRLIDSNISVRTVLAGAEQDISLGQELEFLQSNNSITITTPEKLDTYYRNAREIFDSCSLVIFDEVHKINEPLRGPLIESLISRLLVNQPQTRLILLSGVMSNQEDFVEWLGPSKTKVVASKRRPTRQIRGLAVRHDETPGKPRIRSTGTTRRVNFSGGLVLAHEREDLRGQHGNSADIEVHLPNLFKGYFPEKLIQQNWQEQPGGNRTTSTDHAVSIAKALTRMPGSTLVFVERIAIAERGCKDTTVDPDEMQDARRQQLADFMKLELGESHELVGYCRRGVAYHHARLPTQVQRAIELGLEQGSLKVVFATPTLREGLNTAVSNVILAGNGFWDVEAERRVDVAELDFENLAGRAGRPHRDVEGLVILVPDSLARFRAIQKGQKYLLVGDDALRVISQLEDLERNLAEHDNNFVGLPESDQSFLLGLLAAGFNDEDKLSEFFGQTLWSRQLENEEKLPAVVRASASAIAGADKLAGSEWVELASRTGLSLSSVLTLRQGLTSSLDALTQFSEGADKLDQIIPVLLEICLKLPEIRNGDLKKDIAAVAHAESLRSWISAKSYPDIATAAVSAGALENGTGLNDVVKYCADLSTWLSWAFGASYLVLGSLTDVVDDLIGILPLLTKYGVSSHSAAYISLLGLSDRSAAQTLGDRFDATGQTVAFDAVAEWMETINLESIFPGSIRNELLQRQVSGSWRGVAAYHVTSAQLLEDVQIGDLVSFSEDDRRIFVNLDSAVVGEIVPADGVRAFSRGSVELLVGIIAGPVDANSVSISVIRQVPS